MSASYLEGAPQSESDPRDRGMQLAAVYIEFQRAKRGSPPDSPKDLHFMPSWVLAWPAKFPAH